MARMSSVITGSLVMRAASRHLGAGTCPAARTAWARSAPAGSPFVTPDSLGWTLRPARVPASPRRTPENLGNSIPASIEKSAATSPRWAPGKASAVTAPNPDFELHRRTGADEPHHPREVRPSYPSRPAEPDRRRAGDGGVGAVVGGDRGTAGAGAQGAGAPAEAVIGADLVITMLPTADAVS